MTDRPIFHKSPRILALWFPCFDSTSYSNVFSSIIMKLSWQPKCSLKSVRCLARVRSNEISNSIDTHVQQRHLAINFKLVPICIWIPKQSKWPLFLEGPPKTRPKLQSKQGGPIWVPGIYTYVLIYHVCWFCLPTDPYFQWICCEWAFRD